MSEKLRFPSIKDLQGYTAAYITSKKLTVEQLQDALFENYYGHLKDDIGEGIATAPVLWWKFLYDTVADAIVKTGKHYLHRQDSIIEDGELIKNIAKIILVYFHSQLAGAKIDSAFQVIFQYGGDLISKKDYKTLRGIRGRLRKAVGVKRKSKKVFSTPTPQQTSAAKRLLAQRIDYNLKPKIHSKKARSRYIANIFISCRIGKKPKEKLAETIRTSYLLSAGNPFKDF